MILRQQLHFKKVFLILLAAILTACGRTTIVTTPLDAGTPLAPIVGAHSPFKTSVNMGSTSGNDSARSIAAQADGKIVIGGISETAMVVSRLNTDGTVDTTFGLNGRVFIRVGLVHAWEFLNALVIQPDGKIVVAGSSAPGFGNPGDFALARLNTDGTLDSSFGVGGKLLTDISSGSDDAAYALALQTDGKLIAVGKIAGASNDFAVVRYNANGSLDSSFATGGKLILDLTSGDTDVANGVAVQTDGKIIVTGQVGTGAAKNVAIVRLSAAGVLDAAFGTGGVTRTDLGYNDEDYSVAVAIQPDGKILQAGYNDSGSAFELLRYTSAGVLDSTFATAGLAKKIIGGSPMRAHAMALQADGSIVLTGSALVGASLDFAIMRLTSSGAFDGSFNGNGRVTADFGLSASPDDIAYAALVQNDGKIVLAGEASTPLFTDFAVLRLTVAGNADPGFALSGTLSYDALAGSKDEMYAMIKQPDGKIIEAGRTNFGDTMNFVLTRFNTDGTLDSSFGVSGKVITDIDPSIESADAISAIALQDDGKIIVSGSYYNGAVFASLGFATVRYLADGTLDGTFGTGGIVITNIHAGSDDDPTGIVIQSDGKIIVGGGTRQAGANDSFLVRFTSAGVVDSTFGSSGFVLPKYGAGSFDSTYKVVGLPGDKILIAGSTDAGTSGDDDMAMMRFLSDGTLDTSFGTAGKFTVGFGAGLQEGIFSVTVLSDGKILAGGYTNTGADNNLSVVRFNANGSLDNTFGSAGLFSVVSVGGNSYANDIAVQSDGHLIIGGDSDDGDILVLRATAAGVLDTSFGVNGKYILDFNGDQSADHVTGIVVESDNQIVVGGNTGGTFDREDFYLLRISAAGL